MRILEHWLKRYISFAIPSTELAEKLTMLGLEFENVERLDLRYEGFVVGEVLRTEKHPNADKLSVCMVNAGKETLQVVCGAPNVAPGQKVALGLTGATVPRNQHGPDPFVLSRVRIRGVESSGMICSEYELDMGSDAAGIMVLDPDATVGETLASYFGLDDTAYDVEITPNRPDWLSHFGVAREIAVLTGGTAKLPRVRVKEGKEPIARHLAISVDDPDNCPRFAARMIRGVKIAPSPRWLQNDLRNSGLRPRNNVVDITNFVMEECGHPMHAFDYALLHGGRIVVRQAASGSPFTTLDGREHRLPAGTVMVCDAEREVSIAGVMGGANSEISDRTTDVVLEAACWNPSCIRRTAKALGISSDASQRFERGADPEAVRYALDRAAQLIVETAGGTLLKGVIDVYPKRIRAKTVPLRAERVNLVLGTRLKKAEVVRCLRLIGILPADRSASRFRVPTFRVDIDREIDLIEEVARVHGYDRIEDREIATVNFLQRFPSSFFADELRDTLIGRGYHEAITNSMQGESKSAAAGLRPIRILNPQNQEMVTLRTGLLPGLLETIARNQNLGSADLRFFELGHVFRLDDSGDPTQVEGFLEKENIGMVLTGKATPVRWSEPKREYDIFDIKGEVQDLLAKFALDKSRFISYSTSKGLTDNTLAIEIQGSYAGYLGQVKKELLKQYGIEGSVFCAEMEVAKLQKDAVKKFVALPRYPRVRRDVAFTVDTSIPAESLERTIRESAGELLQTVELFDVYEGKPLTAGTKSVAFTLELMSREKTLTDAEIETAVGRVVTGVEKAHGAALRSMR